MLVKNAPKSGISSVLPFPILYYNFNVNIASVKRSRGFTQYLLDFKTVPTGGIAVSDEKVFDILRKTDVIWTSK